MATNNNNRTTIERLAALEQQIMTMAAEQNIVRGAIGSHDSWISEHKMEHVGIQRDISETLKLQREAVVREEAMLERLSAPAPKPTAMARIKDAMAVLQFVILLVGALIAFFTFVIQTNNKVERIIQSTSTEVRK